MYIARQPIFNEAMKIYGYELLYRESTYAKGFSGTSSKSATAAVVGGLFENGFEHIVGNAKAFVNFDYEFIMSDLIELIDSGTLVIEVLENVKIDQAMLDRLLELKGKGYSIALDDFENDEYSSKAVPYADIIKYDIINTPLAKIDKEVREAKKRKKVLLAEKIETEEEFIQAKKMGFQLFQGYFFCKPNIVSSSVNGKKTSTSVYAQILSEIKNNDFSYDNIVRIIETDVNISYRLLHIIGTRKVDDRFKSIRNVLVRMGKKEIERWISLLMLQEAASDKPDELFRLSLVRSKFSEHIAKKSLFKMDQEEISMMCLFSLINVILDKPMQEAIKSMPLSQDVVNTLLYGSGKFAPILILISAYEMGYWEAVSEQAAILGVKEEEITIGYFEALDWAKRIIEAY